MRNDEGNDNRRGAGEKKVNRANIVWYAPPDLCRAKQKPCRKRGYKAQTDHSAFEPNLEQIVVSVIDKGIGYGVLRQFECWIYRDKSADAAAEWHVSLRRRNRIARKRHSGIRQRVVGEPIQNAIKRKLHGKHDRQRRRRQDQPDRRYSSGRSAPIRQRQCKGA